MMIAGASQQYVDALITRGLQAERSFPEGKGVLYRTSDYNRSTGNPSALLWRNHLAVKDFYDGSDFNFSYIDTSTTPPAINGTSITSMADLEATDDYMQGELDVMFHFTGLATVPAISSNTFLPGAFVQHFTSVGGALTTRARDFFGCGSSGQCPPTYTDTQMSVLEWLENGATGSYGTVGEPQARWARFVDPIYFTEAYLRGATLVEAMWKSVVNPEKGAFVGDPLARPYGWRTKPDGSRIVQTTALKPGSVFSVYSAEDTSHPLRLTNPNLTIPNVQISDIEIPAGDKIVYIAARESTAAPKELYAADSIQCGLRVGAGDVFFCTLTSDRPFLNTLRRFDPSNGNPVVAPVVYFGAVAQNESYVYWLEKNTDGLTLIEFDPITGLENELFTRFDVEGVYLKVSDQFAVWGERPIGSTLPNGVAESLWRWNRTTNSYEQIAGPTSSITLGTERLVFDLSGSDVVLKGFGSGSTTAAAYYVDAALAIHDLSQTTYNVTDVAVGGSGAAWIENDGAQNIAFRSEGFSSKLQIGDDWNVGGSPKTIDFRSSVLITMEGDATESRLILRDLERQTDVLFKSPFGFSSGTVGTAEPSFRPRNFLPGVAALNSGVSFDTDGAQLLYAYDLDVARLLDPTISGKTTQSAGQIGQYIRPSTEFFYDGELDYSAEMLDGSELADHGFEFAVRPAGDINSDGDVNVIDLGLLRAAFFQSDAEADLNNDGVVNFEDLGILRLNFFNKANLQFGYLSWDTSGIQPGVSKVVEITMTINGQTQVRKELVFQTLQ